MNSFEADVDEDEQGELLPNSLVLQNVDAAHHVFLDRHTQTALVDLSPVRLSAGEAAVLDALLSHRSTPLTRDRIQEHAGHCLVGATDARIIDVFICTLGRKLRNAGVPNAIKTVRGQGYMIPGTLQ